MLAKATSDKVYGEINKRLKTLGIKIAFEKDSQRARELETERDILEAKGNKRLKEIGINKVEFKPRYKCNVCNDTGYLRDGSSCKCRLKLIERIENNEI